MTEIFLNLNLIWTVARYNNKAQFQGHYLGIAWEILDPLIQIIINFFIFGGIRPRNDVNVGLGLSYIVVGFFPWMLVGTVAWMFMNKVTLTGATSVSSKMKMVAKLQFPISVLPAMTLASRTVAYLAMTVVMIVVLLFNGFGPSLYWLQAIYYMFAMYVFMYFFALLNSTLTILSKDYIQILRPVMRFMMFFSGVIWRLNEIRNLPNWFVQLMDLNPFSYIITGFRFTFFGQAFFWEHWETTVFFWLLMLVLALGSTHLHLKLRAKFVDLV